MVLSLVINVHHKTDFRGRHTTMLDRVVDLFTVRLTHHEVRPSSGSSLLEVNPAYC